MSNNIDNNLSDTYNCSTSSTNKSGGRPHKEVWDTYNVGEKIGKYYSVQCKYCPKHWHRGIPIVMKSHLAND
ncbi:14493_t:CDS:1, partial [Dentiscutata heterogama]